jgi:hypothetical protein
MTFDFASLTAVFPQLPTLLTLLGVLLIVAILTRNVGRFMAVFMFAVWSAAFGALHFFHPEFWWAIIPTISFGIGAVVMTISFVLHVLGLLPEHHRHRRERVRT